MLAGWLVLHRKLQLLLLNSSTNLPNPITHLIIRSLNIPKQCIQTTKSSNFVSHNIFLYIMTISNFSESYEGLKKRSFLNVTDYHWRLHTISESYRRMLNYKSCKNYISKSKEWSSMLKLWGLIECSNKKPYWINRKWCQNSSQNCKQSQNYKEPKA